MSVGVGELFITLIRLRMRPPEPDYREISVLVAAVMRAVATIIVANCFTGRRSAASITKFSRSCFSGTGL